MLMIKKIEGICIADMEHIFSVAKECLEEYQKGHDIIVVLSAKNESAEEWMKQVRTIHPNPPEREMDMLLAAREQMLAAFFAIALEGFAVPVVSLNAFQIKMHTTNVDGNAVITEIHTDRILEELSQRKIVIATGTQGLNEKNDITTITNVDDMIAALTDAFEIDASKAVYRVLEKKEAVA